MPLAQLSAGPGSILGIAVIIVAGLVVGLGAAPLLRRLPEPSVPDGAADDVRTEYAAKIAYRSLAQPRFVIITAALAAAGMVVATACVPRPYWCCWLVLSTIAMLLAAIDAATTWLPSALIYPGWLAMAVASLIAATLLPDRSWGDRLTAWLIIVGCAVIAGVGYLLLWLLTGGRAVAFGDVRLMPLVGAAAGTLGWPGLYWSVLLGSVVGAVVGIVRLVLRRRGPFPYAPALVAGPYAAALLIGLLH